MFFVEWKKQRLCVPLATNSIARWWNEDAGEQYNVGVDYKEVLLSLEKF